MMAFSFKIFVITRRLYNLLSDSLATNKPYILEQSPKMLSLSYNLTLDPPNYKLIIPIICRVQLKAFKKFENTTEALAATTALVESKLGKDLKSFLKKQVAKKASGEQLGVADPKLAGIIKEKLGVQCQHSTLVNEILRGIRSQMSNLISGLNESDMNNMVLGLSHSLCRYKLKFSPDKVDHMIVQAIGTARSLPPQKQSAFEALMNIMYRFGLSPAQVVGLENLFSLSLF